MNTTVESEKKNYLKGATIGALIGAGLWMITFQLLVYVKV